MKRRQKDPIHPDLKRARFGDEDVNAIKSGALRNSNAQGQLNHGLSSNPAQTLLAHGATLARAVVGTQAGQINSAISNTVGLTGGVLTNPAVTPDLFRGTMAPDLGTQMLAGLRQERAQAVSRAGLLKGLAGNGLVDSAQERSELQNAAPADLANILATRVGEAQRSSVAQGAAPNGSGQPLPEMVQGEAPAAGQDGKDGAAGAKGTQGQLGTQGQQGLQGEQGKLGKRGAAGAVGTAGHDGQDGHNGTDGQRGARGQAGATGQTGQAGATGHNGLDGHDGKAGPKGARGQAGATGQTGQAGATGQDGHDGQSAPAIQSTGNNEKNSFDTGPDTAQTKEHPRRMGSAGDDSAAGSSGGRAFSSQGLQPNYQESEGTVQNPDRGGGPDDKGEQFPGKGRYEHELKPFLPIGGSEFFKDTHDERHIKSMNLALFDSIIRDPQTGDANINPLQMGLVVENAIRFSGDNQIFASVFPGGDLNSGALPATTERLMIPDDILQREHCRLICARKKKNRETINDDHKIMLGLAGATAMPRMENDVRWINNNGSNRDSQHTIESQNTMPVQPQFWTPRRQDAGEVPLQANLLPAQALQRNLQIGMGNQKPSNPYAAAARQSINYNPSSMKFGWVPGNAFA